MNPPHFTTSSARPTNLNDPHNPIVPGRDQKQSSTLSFPMRHEDSGVALSRHTSQTTSSNNLSTLQSPSESQTPYQEVSLDQTQNLSAIRKRFVAPTQAIHIRQSQSGPSDTAYLQSQPFSSTHSSDLFMFIQSLKEDKKKLEEEKTEAITILRKKYEQDIIELKQRVKELEQKLEFERKKIEFERKNLEKHKEETKNQERKLKEQQEKQDLREESLKEKDVDLQSQKLQLIVDQNEFHAQKNELKKTKGQKNLHEENRNLVQQKTQMEEENKISKKENSKQRSELQNTISTQQSKLNEQDEKLQKQERNGKIILIMFIIASFLLLFLSALIILFFAVN